MKAMMTKLADRPSGRVGPLPPGMAGVIIDAYTVYPQIRDLLFTKDGKLFPGIWLDPVGCGRPFIVGFEQDSERQAFITILQEEGWL